MHIMLNPKSWFQAGGTNQRVAHDFFGLFMERGGRFVVGFSVTGLVARHLGTELFGELSFGLALGALGAVVAQLGLDALVTRQVAREPGKAAETLATALLLRVVGLAVILSGLSAGLLLLGSSYQSTAAILVLSLTAVGAVTGIPALWFQAHTLGRWPAWIGFGVFCFASVLRVALVQANGSLMAFAWVAVGETVLSGCATAWLLKKRLKGAGSWRFSWQVAGDFLREGWPLFISSFAVMTYMRVDQMILRALAGAGELGIYAAGLRLAEQGYLIPLTLAPPMLGVLSAKSALGKGKSDMVERYFAVSVLAAYAFVGCVWLAAPWVYRLVFGGDFGQAAAVARIQVLAAPFVFLGVARSQVLVADGLVHFSMWATLAGAAVNLTANLLLAGKFGAMGAAYAGIAAQMVAAWLSTWCYAGTRELARMQTRALLSPWRAFAGTNGSA